MQNAAEIVKVAAISLAPGMFLVGSNRTVTAVYSAKGRKGRAIVYTTNAAGREFRGDWNARTMIGVRADSIPEGHWLRRRMAG